MSSPIEREKPPFLRWLRKYLPWITGFCIVLLIGLLIYTKPSKEEKQKARTAAVKKEIERCKTIPPDECRLAVTGKPTTGTDMLLLVGLLVVSVGGVIGITHWSEARRRKKKKQ